MDDGSAKAISEQRTEISAMVDKSAKASGFLRSMLSEHDGNVSNTRVCVALVVTFALGWVTALVAKVHGPVTVAELSAVLGPLGFFVTGITGTLYAVNKAADVLNNRTAEKLSAQQ